MGTDFDEISRRGGECLWQQLIKLDYILMGDPDHDPDSGRGLCALSAFYLSVLLTAARYGYCVFTCISIVWAYTPISRGSDNNSVVFEVGLAGNSFTVLFPSFESKCLENR